MDYKIKEGIVYIRRGRQTFKVPLGPDLKARIEDQTAFTYQYKNEDFLWIGGFMFVAMGLFFILRVPWLSFLAAIIIAMPLFYRWGRRQVLKEEVEALLSYLETDPEYLIQREVWETQQNIQEEEEKLLRLNMALQNAQTLVEQSKDPKITSEERQEYQTTLDHLQLRIKLRKTKIEFYKKYLHRVQVRKAISMAEEAILTDYNDEENKVKDIKRIQTDTIREDILVLKPLSDQMKLCESELLAQQLIEELNK